MRLIEGVTQIHRFRGVRHGLAAAVYDPMGVGKAVNYTKAMFL